MSSREPGSHTSGSTRRDIIRSGIRYGTLAFSAPALLVACGTADDSAADSPDDTARDDEPGASAGVALANGVDVSQFQGDIDWDAVAASGVQFAFVRATEGTTGVDLQFASNWSGVKSAGLRRGAYHIYDSDAAGNAQAEHFLATVGEDIGDLAPVVDFEGGSPSQTDIQAWLDTVERAAGVKPIIYTVASFADEHLAAFGAYPLWIADYDASSPTLPTSWTDWRVWQHSDDGFVAGISGGVDLNFYKGPLP